MSQSRQNEPQRVGVQTGNRTNTLQPPTVTGSDTINQGHDHRDDWAERPELNLLLPGIGNSRKPDGVLIPYPEEPVMGNIARKREHLECQRLYRGNTPRPLCVMKRT